MSFLRRCFGVGDETIGERLVLMFDIGAFSSGWLIRNLAFLKLWKVLTLMSEKFLFRGWVDVE